MQIQKELVIVGTLGKSTVIDQLVKISTIFEESLVLSSFHSKMVDRTEIIAI